MCTDLCDLRRNCTWTLFFFPPRKKRLVCSLVACTVTIQSKTWLRPQCTLTLTHVRRYAHSHIGALMLDSHTQDTATFAHSFTHTHTRTHVHMHAIHTILGSAPPPPAPTRTDSIPLMTAPVLAPSLPKGETTFKFTPYAGGVGPLIRFFLFLMQCLHIALMCCVPASLAL